MKNRILTLMLISFLSVLAASAQNANKINPVGEWKFDAPYAPEGYRSGTIVIGFAEQKHTATMAFTGSEYKLPGENIKAVNDSVLFSIYLESQDIKVMLKIEDASKMSGKAVYSEGEVPLTLTRATEIADSVKP
jgi:hypothetical protein